MTPVPPRHTQAMAELLRHRCGRRQFLGSLLLAPKRLQQHPGEVGGPKSPREVTEGDLPELDLVHAPEALLVPGARG